ncbi:MAG: hypothetical protein ABSE62_04885 [Chthoniobacteraceae bacterium]|jgi:hypothetical protein
MIARQKAVRQRLWALRAKLISAELFIDRGDVDAALNSIREIHVLSQPEPQEAIKSLGAFTAALKGSGL